MDFWRWVQMKSFGFDIYWPFVNRYWESSGGVFKLGEILYMGEGIIQIFHI